MLREPNVSDNVASWQGQGYISLLLALAMASPQILRKKTKQKTNKRSWWFVLLVSATKAPYDHL